MSPRARWIACVGALGVVGMIQAGCGLDAPDTARIARAIAVSDSLRPRSMPHRDLIGIEDLPVAASADSDSVSWLQINQKYFKPRGRYQMIDGGVMPNPHPFPGEVGSVDPPPVRDRFHDGGRMFDPIEVTGYFIDLCFVVFFVFWTATSFTNKRTVERRGRWIGPIIVIAFGYLLLRAGLMRAPWLNDPLWQRTLLTGLLADAMALAGLAVMLWARVTIGRNWSGGVVLKEDHELVTSGPYRFVRHPIYSGLLLLLLVLGWAVWRGRTGAFLGPAVLLVLFWIKSRAEEQLMIDHFGDAYRSYKTRVKALIPYVV